MEIYEKDIEKEIKDSTITRHGSSKNPALLIKQKDGDKVLKLSSEVEKVD